MKPPICETPCRTVQTCLLCSIPAELWSWINRRARLQQVPPGNLLSKEGDEPTELVVVCSGTIELYYSTSHGRTAIRKRARAGDLLGYTGLLAKKPFDVSAMTVEWCQLRFVKKDDFFHLLEAVPALRDHIEELIAQELYETRLRLREFLLHIPTEVRTARLLLSHCQHRPEVSKGFPQRVKLTLKEMAQILGVTDRGMGKAWKKLKSQGWVEQQRGWVVILDPEGLKKLGESFE